MTGEERNREVDAAWRAASTEEPPPELDAAIRAEARRAVGTGPRAARRRRYRQWRYPFAAAATVALLAFGIAQMTPPDQVGTSLVSDEPATPQARAPAAQPPAAQAARRAENGAAGAQAKKESRRNEPPADERFATAPPQTAPPPRAATAPLAQAPASADKPVEMAQGAPGAETSESTAGSVTRNAAQGKPFPAASPERERAARPMPEGPVEPPGVATASARAKVSNVDELKAKQAGAESVEAWIARIRALRASGAAAAAARELAAFRDAFGDRADALLPQDLRGVTAADGKGR